MSDKGNRCPTFCDWGSVLKMLKGMTTSESRKAEAVSVRNNGLLWRPQPKAPPCGRGLVYFQPGVADLHGPKANHGRCGLVPAQVGIISQYCSKNGGVVGLHIRKSNGFAVIRVSLKPSTSATRWSVCPTVGEGGRFGLNCVKGLILGATLLLD